jgi:hypothetical protein
MLINLTPEFVAQLGGANKTEIAQFEDVLSHHERLFHYVGARRKVVSEIKAAVGNALSERSHKTLDLIATQSDDLQQILTQTKFYAEVRTLRQRGVQFEENNGICRWICGIDAASKWFSGPLKLVAENIVDARAYSEAARQYAVLSDVQLTMARHSKEMSGGSGNANVVLEERLKDGIAPVLCVIDSDKIFPAHGGSASVGKCRKVIEDIPGVGFFFATQERELENILPIPFVEAAIDAMNRSVERDILLDNLKVMKEIAAKKPTVYPHIDIKNGTCLAWIESKKDDAFRYFGKEKVRQACGCKKSCGGKISPPLVEAILDKTVELMAKSAPREIRLALKDMHISSWVELGAMVFAMSMCNNLRST